MSANRICICCGEKFKYCPSCGVASQPTWKRVYDSKECMEIANILLSSRGPRGISKEEAKRQMQQYPDALEKIFDYDSLTANAIKEIFGIKDGEQRKKAVTTYIPSKEEAGKIEKVNPVIETNVDVVDIIEEQEDNVGTFVEQETKDVESTDSEEVEVAEKNSEPKKTEYRNSGNRRKRNNKK